MSHYRAIIISDNGEDFDEIIKPFNELDSRYYTRHNITDIENRYAQFLKYNPNWVNVQYDEWAKEMNYSKDEKGWYREYNDNTLYDWYTEDGGDFLVERYVIPDAWPEVLRVEDIDWARWALEEHQDDEYVEIPILIIYPDGTYNDMLAEDNDWEKYSKEFWNIPKNYKGKYVRFDDFHI